MRGHGTDDRRDLRRTSHRGPAMAPFHALVHHAVDLSGVHGRRPRGMYVRSGVSVGSLSWFEGGTTDSYDPELRPLTDGLDFLPYGNGVHHDSDPGRRPLLHRLVADGTLAPPAGGGRHPAREPLHGRRRGLVHRGTERVEAVTRSPDCPPGPSPPTATRHARNASNHAGCPDGGRAVTAGCGWGRARAGEPPVGRAAGGRVRSWLWGAGAARRGGNALHRAGCPVCDGRCLRGAVPGGARTERSA